MPTAIYHIQLNVRDFARSLSFYKALGFEEDHGADFKEGSPPLDLTNFVREVGADPQDAQIALLRLSTDPYGHIELACWERRVRTRVGAPNSTVLASCVYAFWWTTSMLKSRRYGREGFRS